MTDDLLQRESAYAAKLDRLQMSSGNPADIDFGLDLFGAQRALAFVMMQRGREDAHYHLQESEKTLKLMKSLGTINQKEYNKWEKIGSLEDLPCRMQPELV